MKIEHFAINVSEPTAMAAWYVKHCKLRIAHHLPEPCQTHFLADQESSVLEIYHNPNASIPDYSSMDPLVLHLAFTSDDPRADSKRLMEAGASFCSEMTLPDNTHLIMLRDPWGVAIQLCKRPTPLLKK